MRHPHGDNVSQSLDLMNDSICVGHLHPVLGSRDAIVSNDVVDFPEDLCCQDMEGGGGPLGMQLQ